MRPEISQVIEVARKEIGVREVGSSNTGKRVQQYQKATTLGGSGWPWCAAFAAWVMLTALGKAMAGELWLNSASCDFILFWARKLGILSTEPEVGCFGLVMASPNDATHIFLVEDIVGNTLTTIEGNTNVDGSREGNGVYRRKRTKSSRYLYVLWAKRLPAEQVQQTWELWGSTKIADMPIRDGRMIIPAWKWAEWFDMKLGWNAEAQVATLNGREVPGQPLMLPDKTGINRAWNGVRELAQVTGLMVQDEPGKITLLR